MTFHVILPHFLMSLSRGGSKYGDQRLKVRFVCDNITAPDCC